MPIPLSQDEIEVFAQSAQLDLVSGKGIREFSTEFLGRLAATLQESAETAADKVEDLRAANECLQEELDALEEQLEGAEEKRALLERQLVEAREKSASLTYASAELIRELRAMGLVSEVAP